MNARRRPPLLLGAGLVTTLAMLAVLGYLLLSLGAITDGLTDARIMATQSANGQRDLLMLQHSVDRLALGGSVREAKLWQALSLQQLRTLQVHAPQPPTTDFVARVRAIDLESLSTAKNRRSQIRRVDREVSAIERDFKEAYDGSDLRFRATVNDALSAKAGAQRLLAALIALTLLVAGAGAIQVRRRTRSDLRAAREAVLESERRFRALVQNSFDLTVVTGIDGVITYASPALERLTGTTAEQAIGLALQSLASQAELVDAILQRVAGGSREQLPVEFALKHSDGSLRKLDGTVVNLLDEPAVGAIVFNVRDVTQRRRLELELAELAFHDPLTGLANRALLHERIDHAAARALRAPETDAALMLIDLDDFKSVNDSLGHGEGDRLLTEVARRLEAATRTGDTVARLGGDEFVVFAESLGGREQASVLAERVLSALEAPFELGVGVFHCRASMGMRFTSSRTLHAEDLLRDADLAMYSAKNAGKGSWRLFESGMHDQASEQLLLRSELHRALDEGEFVLHYQAIVDLDTEAVTGFEALVRWEHPERGLLGPDRFITLAESSGLIHALGAWVLDEATSALRRIQLLSANFALTMNVNLSPLQLESDTIVEDVRAALAASSIPAHQVILEVTEGVFLAETTMVTERFEALHGLGVRIALDDFGTGFSSLGYLERLPLEVLKIDRAFVASLDSGDNRGQIVAAITGLAAGLGLATVAEGIETREQLIAARELGCDRGQGYLFARPVAEAAAVEALRRSVVA